MATIARSAGDSAPAGSRTSAVQPSVARVAAAASASVRHRTSRLTRPRAKRPTRMLSTTEALSTSPRSWCTNAMPSASSWPADSGR